MFSIPLKAHKTVATDSSSNRSAGTFQNPQPSASINVLNIGPSLAQRGGMATVQNWILKSSPDHINIQHLTTHDEGSYWHRGTIFTKALLVYVLRLLRQEIDLVHIHVSERGSVARQMCLTWLAFLFRRPVVIHTHGAEFQPFFESLPSAFKQILRLTFQNCDAFITLSQSWHHFYCSALRLDPQRVLNLPNPIACPPHLPNRASRDTLKLVFCGRVGQRKGTFDLLHAYAKLPEDIKQQTQLLIAGDGDLDQGKALAQELELSQVRFLGWVEADECNQLLKQADIFILPSYNEGLPVAVLEAMAWGLPIITTPVGGIPDVIVSEQNGLLVPPGDLKALTHALIQLIQDPELRLSLGSAARSVVEPLDIKHYASRLAKIYEGLSSFPSREAHQHCQDIQQNPSSQKRDVF